VFGYETVLDAREFERPANYALLRVKPEPGMKVDPAKRPFVVVDPRAEAIFLQKVMELHPESESKPCVIGNCQAGWAVAMLSAAAPEVTGPIVLAGSPLSYWAGVEGKNPMRYLGGLLGGTWLTALWNDLGNGKFDGAHLVSNFENLNPANTLWTKQYNLYSKIDTEEDRYLNFEKWWGGFFLMNAEEMEFIVNNLFVGNKLEDREIVTTTGKHVDLRNIRSPILVFASWGDNITPPQQALHWILDLYKDVDEIRANEQVIVYHLHEHVGHLGIFVSGKVARKEHAETVENMDIIDVLPPGLYEAVIEEKNPTDHNVDLLPGDYTVRFEERSLDDIRALGEDESGERLFETVSRVSEINEGIYRTFVRPWLTPWINEQTAEALRTSQPLRAQRYVLSDLNPFMAQIESLAETVRSDRRPVPNENPFWQWQEAVSDQIISSLDLYRDVRDNFGEQMFRAIYDSPWLQALTGQRSSAAEKPKVHTKDAAREALIEKRWEEIKAREYEGGFNEAVIRIALYCGKGNRRIDTRGLRYAQKLQPGRPPMGLRKFKETVRVQAALVELDEELAIKSLPHLLPKMEERRDAVALAREIMGAAGPIDERRAGRLRKIEDLLGVEPPRTETHRKATAKAAPRKPKPQAKAAPASRRVRTRAKPTQGSES
jgi:hypothetical protein